MDGWNAWWRSVGPRAAGGVGRGGKRTGAAKQERTRGVGPGLGGSASSLMGNRRSRLAREGLLGLRYGSLGVGVEPTVRPSAEGRHQAGIAVGGASQSPKQQIVLDSDDDDI